jgi:hypothetical protein
MHIELNLRERFDQTSLFKHVYKKKKVHEKITK